MGNSGRRGSIARIAIAAACLVLAQLARTAIAAEALDNGTHTIDTKVQLTARFVTLPDVPSVTAKGEGSLEYIVSKSKAIIAGASIFDLVAEVRHPPAPLASLTVIAAGIPGADAVLDWSAYPRISLSGLALRVQAYDAPAAQITPRTTPVLDIVLDDLDLSTDAIIVEGVEASGYIDLEAPEAQVVGKAILPEDPFAPYAETLAGKPIIVELRARVPNPYAR